MNMAIYDAINKDSAHPAVLHRVVGHLLAPSTARFIAFTHPGNTRT
jgi:hypothetical protein